MEHLRSDEVAVDTSKFKSWPLLRPDELTTLPTEVLRASVADLDTMCRHASGEGKEAYCSIKALSHSRTKLKQA